MLSVSPGNRWQRGKFSVHSTVSWSVPSNATTSKPALRTEPGALTPA